MGLISISDVKKVKWTMFEQNLMEKRWFQFFISGTPDSQRTFFWLSCLPDWPNKLAYLTFISSFVCRFSESVQKMKICPLVSRLWPPEVQVKKFLEFQKSNAIFRWVDFISVKEFDSSFFIIWAKFLKFEIKFRFWHWDPR